VPPIKEVDVALFGQVALEEPSHHAYSQTWFESPYLLLGELPYLFVVGARLSRHVYKDLAMKAFSPIFLKQDEDSLPKRVLCFPRFLAVHALRFPFDAAVISAALALKPVPT
jgi:hypothetical protein